MSKGDVLKITVAPFADGKKPGYFNNSKEVTLNFTDCVFHKQKNSPYCIQVGCLVQMFPNCPSIDFYTIQENADNVTAEDVTSDVPDDENFADRNDKTYTVYVIQATVGQQHGWHEIHFFFRITGNNGEIPLWQKYNICTILKQWCQRVTCSIWQNL